MSGQVEVIVELTSVSSPTSGHAVRVEGGSVGLAPPPAISEIYQPRSSGGGQERLLP